MTGIFIEGVQNKLLAFLSQLNLSQESNANLVSTCLHLVIHKLSKNTKHNYYVYFKNIHKGYEKLQNCPAYNCTGQDPGFAKRGDRVSKLRENWLIWHQNRLNLHNLVVKRGGGAGPNRPIPGSARRSP